jgi:segregation and condensation protein B
MLVEDREELSLATSGECAPVVERFLEVSSTEALSAAALQVLAIIAYEQPVTRADIARIRSVDSDGVVVSLLARGLVAEEHRFAGRGAPVPLVTTTQFLQHFGLNSLAASAAVDQPKRAPVVAPNASRPSRWPRPGT